MGLRQNRPATIQHVADLYLNDPTSVRTAKSLLVYRTTYAAFIDILGNGMAISSISREVCRDALTVLQSLPSNARKRWPKLSPREIAAKARSEDIPPMSSANVNEYMNKLSTLLNWAVKEEMIDRNPAQGLRIATTMAARDKRKPFTAKQLRMIFDAPIYRGCRDDGPGFTIRGEARPKRARFWIPLIALFSGMRQNEICQMDVGDVRTIEGVLCFVVSVGSSTDKSLKQPSATGSSQSIRA